MPRSQGIMALGSALPSNYWEAGMGISSPRSSGKSRELLAGAGGGGSSRSACGLRFHFSSWLWGSYSLCSSDAGNASQGGNALGEIPPRVKRPHRLHSLHQEQAPAVFWRPQTFPLCFKNFVHPGERSFIPGQPGGGRRTRESWGERNKQI